jgi:hypothetical protein
MGMVKIISWNIGRNWNDCWRCLLEGDADIALVQEARKPPADVAERLGDDAVSPGPWRTAGGGRRPWRAAVVKLSKRVGVQWFVPRSFDDPPSDVELEVSRPGTLAAALVTPGEGGGTPFIVASMYGAWEDAHVAAYRAPVDPDVQVAPRWIYADASVHRVISDLSVFVGEKSNRRGRYPVLAAGDLNIFHGYGDEGSPYWAARYKTIFQRMEALGLAFLGPQSPNGRQPARPWPRWMPPDSGNVPTYHTTAETPETANRQLDFVFASRGFAERVQVRALNGVEEWAQATTAGSR